MGVFQKGDNEDDVNVIQEAKRRTEQREAEDNQDGQARDEADKVEDLESKKRR